MNKTKEQNITNLNKRFKDLEVKSFDDWFSLNADKLNDEFLIKYSPEWSCEDDLMDLIESDRYDDFLSDKYNEYLKNESQNGNVEEI